MTAEQHAARIERIRAERKAAGRSETIQTPSVYALLAAVLDSQLSADEEQSATRR